MADDVMQVADTGFHPKGQCLYDVIPVLDTGIHFSIIIRNVVF
ncbi:hypothetical protein [Wolbachia endosymbiont (group B) of Limnophora tigrina]